MTQDTQPVYDRYSDIRPVEGEVIGVKGTLTGPGSGKPLFKLQLRRTESIALGHISTSSSLDWDQIEGLVGDKVMIRGRVFFEHIPDEYGIYARTGAPYLVDMSSIERLP